MSLIVVIIILYLCDSLKVKKKKKDYFVTNATNVDQIIAQIFAYNTLKVEKNYSKIFLCEMNLPMLYGNKIKIC